MILTNDGRITERLLSSAYTDEKEYVVTTSVRSAAVSKKMEKGPCENETKKCGVKILNENTFAVTLTERNGIS